MLCFVFSENIEIYFAEQTSEFKDALKSRSVEKRKEFAAQHLRQQVLERTKQTLLHFDDRQDRKSYWYRYGSRRGVESDDLNANEGNVLATYEASKHRKVLCANDFTAWQVAMLRRLRTVQFPRNNCLRLEMQKVSVHRKCPLPHDSMSFSPLDLILSS